MQPILSADEVARAIRAGFGRPMQFVIEELRAGYARTRTPLDRASMLRPGGVLSGPTLFEAADLAMYAVVLGHIGPQLMAVTSDLSIRYLRKAAPADVLKAIYGANFKLSPPRTASEDFSEYAGAGIPSMMFNIGVYDQERITTARNGGAPIPSNHSPLFAPVPRPTIETGVTAMTLAVMSAFNRHKGK